MKTSQDHRTQSQIIANMSEFKTKQDRIITNMENANNEAIERLKAKEIELDQYIEQYY